MRLQLWDIAGQVRSTGVFSDDDDDYGFSAARSLYESATGEADLGIAGQERERKSVLAAFSASFSGLSVCLRGPALSLARCLSCSMLIAESCTSSAARAAAVCLSTARAGNRGFGR